MMRRIEIAIAAGHTERSTVEKGVVAIVPAERVRAEHAPNIQRGQGRSGWKNTLDAKAWAC
jgi:hypothetical protein